MVILDNVPNGAQCLYSHTEAVLWEYWYSFTVHSSLHFYGTLQMRILLMLIQQHIKLEVSTSNVNLTKCSPPSGPMLAKFCLFHIIM